MRTELRFVLAVVLMFGVIFATNILFPPVIPEAPPTGDSTAVGGGGGAGAPGAGAPDGGAAGATTSPSTPSVPSRSSTGAPSLPGAGPEVAQERLVTVAGPLYRFTFSSYGARMVVGELPQFEALNGGGGAVQMVPEGVDGYLGQRLVVGADTVDLRRAAYRVEPQDGLQLAEGGPSGTLRFIYEHPTSDFRFEVAYTFDPGFYVVGVEGRASGVDRPLLLTDLGEGLPYSEADSANEAGSMAYVYNQLGGGIQSTLLSRGEPRVVQGPLEWAAFRSKFFVLALLAGRSEELTTDADYLGGLIVRRGELAGRVRVETAQGMGPGGGFAYRMFMGPQDYSRLSSLGQDMDEVNPYGWRIFRPIVRPFVAVINGVLFFLHTNLSLGYGWVLILVGVLMRIVLFPLNHKAMKAQLRNMAVQPLVQEVQAKHKDNPEKLQKEMLRLYKEHGFNPLAGCLPMLLPWPVLIALFFVFQNTIELRGVSFLWLPDLSARDPLYILPVLLAISMFLMQWVSLRSLDQPNPQMKMMMYIMPPFMLMIFLNLASGLNLYYATANVATIPQQMWIANERKKMRGQPPPRRQSD